MKRILLTACSVALIAVAITIGYNVVGAEKVPRSPNSVEPILSLQGPNWELKAQNEPEHNEVTVPLEDAGRPPVWSNGQQPSDEEIAQRLALEQLNRPFATRLQAEDLRRNPWAGSSNFVPSTNRVDLLAEGFEGGVVPPTGWSTTVANPYTWEIDGASSYEGSYGASCFYDPTYSGTQNEWLISPSVDLTTSGTAWVLEFYWLGSYYWSVDPNNNCDLEIYVSTDGGATWGSPIWSENEVGVFDNWVWYNTTLPLTAYLGETDVKIAFRYYGFDGAQFSLDAISINDAAVPVGRCCYGEPTDPSCEDEITESDCGSLGGNWSSGLNCTDDPCPIAGENDECTTAELVSGPFPATVNGTTVGAQIDCPGVLDWNAVWYKFELPYECNNVEIDFCGTSSDIQCIGIVLYDQCEDCNAYILSTGFSFDACGDGSTNPRIWWDFLSGPATYYFPVFTGDAGCGPFEQDFQFTINIEECPPPADGDNCDIPIIVDIAGSEALPVTLLNQYTCGRLDYYNATCLGVYDGGEDIIYEVNVSTAIDVDITLDAKGTTYTGFVIDGSCPPDPSTCIGTSTSSSGSPHTMFGVHLEPGTYYVMVDTWPSPDCIPDFDLTFAQSAGPTPGDDCTDPQIVKLPDDLPYLDAGQMTCGRGNNYDATCLGSYDGGEDIIYEIEVSSTVTLDIVLDPNGTTWSGMSIDDECPDANSTCIATVTSSSGSPKGFYGITLGPGIYYIMVDTYPSPTCIPNFSLSISEAEACTTNDCWEFCEEIGNVVDQAYTTVGSTPDGPGGCMSSGNIWYCYTATCTGPATVSLCGSSYDTYLGIYDGVDPNTAALIGCNDDYCGLQSQITFDAVTGNTYLIEVGGYSSNTGDGVISIECTVCDAPENDNCESVTPVALTLGTPVTFTGDNTCATNQCASFPGGHVWEAFTTSATANITLSYCGTSPAFGNAWLNLGLGCPCTDFTTAGTFNFDDCGDGNVTIYWEGMPAGTYYYPVLLDPGNNAEGPYSITVLAGEGELAYCSASGGCDEYISNVTVGDINNTTVCDNYGDYTALSTDMEVGGSYPISVTIGNAYSADQGAVWIDWNQDFVFDVTTEAVTMDVSSGLGPYTGTVVVPGDALPGTTRMRVRLNWNAPPPPCGTTTYGEAEDYSINVVDDAAPTWAMDPCPKRVVMKYALEPITGHLYISEAYASALGYSLSDVDLGSVAMVIPTSGCSVPISGAELLASHESLPGMGQVLDISYPVTDYILCVQDGTLIWDEIVSSFDVTYDYTGGPSGGLSGTCNIIGHISGDVNLDGNFTVTDLTFMVDFIFRGGDAPLVLETGDVDANGKVNIRDLTMFVDFIFRGGSELTHP